MTHTSINPHESSDLSRNSLSPAIKAVWLYIVTSIYSQFSEKGMSKETQISTQSVINRLEQRVAEISDKTFFTK
jgi:hypothetical protein